MDLWQIGLDILDRQGLAVFLVVTFVILSVWFIRWLMNTAYPDFINWSQRALDVRHAEASALSTHAEATSYLARVLRELHAEVNGASMGQSVLPDGDLSLP